MIAMPATHLKTIGLHIAPLPGGGGRRSSNCHLMVLAVAVAIAAAWAVYLSSAGSAGEAGEVVAAR